MSVVRQVQLPVHRPACVFQRGRERSRRDEASTVEVAVSVNCREERKGMKEGSRCLLAPFRKQTRARRRHRMGQSGKSLAGQKRKSRKGSLLRRGLDEAQTASVTPRGAPHCPGASKSGMGARDSGEPAVSRPCLWGDATCRPQQHIRPRGS